MKLDTLYDLLIELRKKIIEIHNLRDSFNFGTAQHYWTSFAAKRFELSYEHLQYAALARMHWSGRCVPTSILNNEDKTIYLHFKADSEHYWRNTESVDTLITEKFLDINSSLWFGFESLIHSIIVLNKIDKQRDFTEDYKKLILSSQHPDGGKIIEFLNGYKLIRHSEHHNYRPKRSFVITIPSLNKRIAINGNGHLDIGNKFYMLSITSDMIYQVLEILFSLEKNTDHILSTGYETG